MGRKPNWHISFHDPDLYKGKKKSSEKKGIEKKGIFHLVIGGRYFPLVFEGESYKLNLKKEYGENTKHLSDAYIFLRALNKMLAEIKEMEDFKHVEKKEKSEDFEETQKERRRNRAAGGDLEPQPLPEVPEPVPDLSEEDSDNSSYDGDGRNPAINSGGSKRKKLKKTKKRNKNKRKSQRKKPKRKSKRKKSKKKFKKTKKR